MTAWRCPHCATPQPESSRCWVCRRSSTCCATCRHFRRSVADRIGFCGLDPRRAALAGDEIRACWEWPLDGARGHRQEPAPATGPRTPVLTRRTFVAIDVGPIATGDAADIEALTAASAVPAGSTRVAGAAVEAPPALEARPAVDGDRRWALFPDFD